MCESKENFISWGVLSSFLLSALDLKKGSVYKGEPEAGTKADTTLTIDDDDMVDMVIASFTITVYL